MENNNPRILFIANNPFSLTSNNGKTYTSIFENWGKANIAQLYFHRELPDRTVCNSFYQITEEQQLFKSKQNVGNIITKEHTNDEREKNFHKLIRKNPSQFKLFVRNMIWRLGKWDNEKLEHWVKDFSPDIIFFVGGQSEFTYRVTRIISNKLSIPICFYYTDDYFYDLNPFDIISRINRALVLYQIKRMKRRVKKIFVIGEKMKEEYSKRFSIECIPVMNSIDLFDFRNIDLPQTGKIIKLAYFGGLHLKRIDQLIKLSFAIEEYNKTNEQKYSLSIYTGSEMLEEERRLLQNNEFTTLGGFIDSESIISEMCKFDLLVHIESFEPSMIKKTRLSLSTKIPEYLAMKRPILAIGPRNIASIEYISSLTGNFICVSTRLDKMKETLGIISAKKNSLHKIGLKNYKVVEKNHTRKRTKRVVKEQIQDALNYSK